MSHFVAPRPQNIKLSLQTRKPRNPLVGPSLMRQAGSHARGNERQTARRDLQRQIAALDKPSP